MTRSSYPITHKLLFEQVEGDYNHVRCVLCGRTIGIAGNFGGGANRHAEAHIRRGDPIDTTGVRWGGRGAWQYYKVPV